MNHVETIQGNIFYPHYSSFVCVHDLWNNHFPSSSNIHPKTRPNSAEEDRGKNIPTALKECRLTFVDEHHLDSGAERNVVHMKALAVVVLAASAWDRVFDRANPRVVPAAAQQQGRRRTDEGEVVHLWRRDLLVLTRCGRKEKVSVGSFVQAVFISWLVCVKGEA